MLTAGYRNIHDDNGTEETPLTIDDITYSKGLFSYIRHNLYKFNHSISYTLRLARQVVKDVK